MEEPEEENEINDPLPIEALQFGNVLHELCGEACIAGSAPLAKYFHNLRQQNDAEELSETLQKILSSIDSNDVDVFAPLFPRKLAKKRASKNFHKMSRKQQARYLESRFTYPNRDPTKVCTLLKCELGLWEVGLEMHDINQKAFDEQGVSRDQCSLWNEAVNIGIRHIHNFKLRYSKDKKPCNVQMQLILLDGLPPQEQSWEDYITESFDIDIVKGTAKIDDINDLGTLNFKPHLLEKIRRGVFSYNIRNCIDLDTLVSRIQKYLKRGFQLDNLEFANDCSDLFRLHVTRKLRYHLTSTICYKWFEDNGYQLGIATAVLPTIKRFVRGPTYAKRIFRAMQLEEMRRKFEKNDWWSVGHQKLCKDDFEWIVREEQSKRCAVLRIERWLLACKEKNLRLEESKRVAVLRIERWFLACKKKNAAKKPSAQLLGKRKTTFPINQPSAKRSNPAHEH